MTKRLITRIVFIFLPSSPRPPPECPCLLNTVHIHQRAMVWDFDEKNHIKCHKRFMRSRGAAREATPAAGVQRVHRNRLMRSRSLQPSRALKACVTPGFSLTGPCAQAPVPRWSSGWPITDWCQCCPCCPCADTCVSSSPECPCAWP